jgi:hypothetical protein
MQATYHNHVIELEQDRYSRALRWHCFIEGQYLGYFENQERSVALDKAKQILDGWCGITAQPIATEIRL